LSTNVRGSEIGIQKHVLTFHRYFRNQYCGVQQLTDWVSFVARGCPIVRPIVMIILSIRI